MTQQEALTPFEALEVFKGYSTEDKEVLCNDMFLVEFDKKTGKRFIAKQNIPQMLEILAHLRFGMDFMDFCYNYGKQFVVDYVDEQKGVKVLDGKYTVANRTIYDYKQSVEWVYGKDGMKQMAEYMKQLEKTCQTGGIFDGKIIEKVPSKTEKELRFTIDK